MKYKKHFSLTTRFIVLLTLGLFLIQAMGFSLIVWEAWRTHQRSLPDMRIVQLVTLLEKLDGSPKQNWQTIAENSPLDIEADIINRQNDGRRGGWRLERRLTARLHALTREHDWQSIPANLQVLVRRRSRQDHEITPDNRQRDRNSYRSFLVNLPLAETQVLQLRLSLPSAENRMHLVFMGLLISTVIFAALMGWWVVKRLTRPLEDMAKGADILARNIYAAPMTMTGVTEIDKSRRSFNALQEAVHALLAEKNLMIGALGHDLKTILTRLRLRLEFINDDQQRDKAIKNAATMQQLIDDSLEFARSNLSTQDTMKNIDLNTLLQEIFESYAQEKANITYEPTDGEIQINAHPAHLRRAIANVIDNALRYGGQADITMEQSAGKAVIIIKDPGPGIETAEQEKVFTPFYRADTARNQDKPGHGLGLAIAKNYIEQSAGTIELQSPDAAGLSVVIKLPLSHKRG